jgi:tetratricopeptide (TPR) repeat protein
LHSTEGLALLETLPDTPERKQLELRLRQLVSAALYATRGFINDDLEANLQRARQLCRELEDNTTLVSVLVGLGRLYLIHANYAALAELEQEEERLAAYVQDAKLLVQLHTQLATIATSRGLHVRAAEHYHHVLRHYDPEDLPFLLPSFSGNPLVVASSWSSVSVSLAGQPDQGWGRAAQALVRAEEFSQPLAVINGLLCAALVRLLRGDYDEARQLAHKLDALTQEHHITVYQICGRLIQGCIAVRRGAWGEGITGITTELSEYRAIGAQYLVPFFLSFLAEAYRHQGKIDEALQVVSEALSLTATNLDVFWEAELYRLKGGLSLQVRRIEDKSTARQRQVTRKFRTGQKKYADPQSHIPSPQSRAEAEACFQQAIEIARQQGAKLLELRATTSLARLWQQQDKQRDAHRTLSEIYSWFTEGFDTVDLKTARTLLAEWSASS